MHISVCARISYILIQEIQSDLLSLWCICQIKNENLMLFLSSLFISSSMKEGKKFIFYVKLFCISFM